MPDEKFFWLHEDDDFPDDENLEIIGERQDDGTFLVRYGPDNDCCCETDCGPCPCYTFDDSTVPTDYVLTPQVFSPDKYNLDLEAVAVGTDIQYWCAPPADLVNGLSYDCVGFFPGQAARFTGRGYLQCPEDGACGERDEVEFETISPTYESHHFCYTPRWDGKTNPNEITDTIGYGNNTTERNEPAPTSKTCIKFRVWFWCKKNWDIPDNHLNQFPIDNVGNYVTHEGPNLQPSYINNYWAEGIVTVGYQMAGGITPGGIPVFPGTPPGATQHMQSLEWGWFYQNAGFEQGNDPEDCQHCPPIPPSYDSSQPGVWPNCPPPQYSNDPDPGIKNSKSDSYFAAGGGSSANWVPLTGCDVPPWLPGVWTFHHAEMEFIFDPPLDEDASGSGGSGGGGTQPGERSIRLKTTVKMGNCQTQQLYTVGVFEKPFRPSQGQYADISGRLKIGYNKKEPPDANAIHPEEYGLLGYGGIKHTAGFPSGQDIWTEGNPGEGSDNTNKFGGWLVENLGFCKLSQSQIDEPASSSGEGPTKLEATEAEYLWNNATGRSCSDQQGICESLDDPPDTTPAPDLAINTTGESAHDVNGYFPAIFNESGSDEISSNNSGDGTSTPYNFTGTEGLALGRDAISFYMPNFPTDTHYYLGDYPTSYEAPPPSQLPPDVSELEHEVKISILWQHIKKTSDNTCPQAYFTAEYNGEYGAEKQISSDSYNSSPTDLSYWAEKQAFATTYTQFSGNSFNPFAGQGAFGSAGPIGLYHGPGTGQTEPLGTENEHKYTKGDKIFSRYDYVDIVSSDIGGLSESLDYLPGANVNEWNTRTVDISAHAGRKVKLIFHYESGSDFKGDIQIDNIQIDGLTYSFESSTESFETTATDTPISNYENATWSNLGTATTSNSDNGKWNRNSGGTRSSNTGRTDADDGSYYVYAEVTQSFDSNFLLRSPEITLGSNPTLSYAVARYGQDIGDLNVHLDVQDSGDTSEEIFALRTFTVDVRDRIKQSNQALIRISGYIDELFSNIQQLGQDRHELITINVWYRGKSKTMMKRMPSSMWKPNAQNADNSHISELGHLVSIAIFPNKQLDGLYFDFQGSDYTDFYYNRYDITQETDAQSIIPGFHPVASSPFNNYPLQTPTQVIIDNLGAIIGGPGHNIGWPHIINDSTLIRHPRLDARYRINYNSDEIAWFKKIVHNDSSSFSEVLPNMFKPTDDYKNPKIIPIRTHWILATGGSYYVPSDYQQDRFTTIIDDINFLIQGGGLKFVYERATSLNDMLAGSPSTPGGLTQSLDSLPGADVPSWNTRTVDISAYAGRTVKVVFHYVQSDSEPTYKGDIQLDDINIDGTNHSFENHTHPWETTVTLDAGTYEDISSYDGASFTSLSTGNNVYGRWQRDKDGTNSSGTGMTTGNTGSYYLYPETSNGNHGDAYSRGFFLRTTSFVLGSNPTLSYAVAQNGQEMGDLNVYLDIEEEAGDVTIIEGGVDWFFTEGNQMYAKNNEIYDLGSDSYMWGQNQDFNTPLQWQWYIKQDSSHSEDNHFERFYAYVNTETGFMSDVKYEWCMKRILGAIVGIGYANESTAEHVSQGYTGYTSTGPISIFNVTSADSFVDYVSADEFSQLDKIIMSMLYRPTLNGGQQILPALTWTEIETILSTGNS